MRSNRRKRTPAGPPAALEDNGLKVLGSIEALPVLVPELGIEQVITTIADAPQVQLRRIVKICEGVPVRAQMIPAMYDLLQGKVSISGLREVRVEDLLHRETVSLKVNEIRAFLGAFLPEAQMNGGFSGGAGLSAPRRRAVSGRPRSTSQDARAAGRSRPQTVTRFQWPRTLSDTIRPPMGRMARTIAGISWIVLETT